MYLPVSLFMVVALTLPFWGRVCAVAVGTLDATAVSVAGSTNTSILVQLPRVTQLGAGKKPDITISLSSNLNLVVQNYKRQSSVPMSHFYMALLAGMKATAAQATTFFGLGGVNLDNLVQGEQLLFVHQGASVDVVEYQRKLTFDALLLVLEGLGTFLKMDKGTDAIFFVRDIVQDKEICTGYLISRASRLGGEQPEQIKSSS